ncbi:MAG: T9SS type A sorting domain-containing protein [Bacteroidetes bacterium]|nr:T9SS type A sorting domain-containing protein [Bacteroidota bacterium]
MNSKKVFLALLLPLLLTPAMAQDLQCGSHYEVSPEEMATEAYRAHQQAYLQRLQQVNKRSSGENFDRILFPVVVHVIHSGNGQVDSLSEAQVRSMFPLLNMQLRQYPGSPYHGGAGVDMYVEFELATIDPQGNPTTGITYTRNSTLANLNSDADNATLKNTIRWNTERYCNVWLTRSITGGGGLPLGGYAQFPNSAFPSAVHPTYANTDGVVILGRLWGTEGSADSPWESTTVHELGHWLGLFHPFQGSCHTTPCNISGDWVCDTPPAVGRGGNPAVFANALARLNSCAETNDRADLHHDFMDYSTPTVRQSLFTAGQRARAHSFIAAPGEPRRYDMWQEENHELTGIGLWGALDARFAATLTHAYTGTSVTFKDYSRNIAQTYEWTFEGGTPATSDQPSPVVTWDTPGSYDVTLRVTNFEGSSEVTLEDYIVISDERQTFPLTATFASGLPSGWRFDNPDAGKADAFTSPFTWEYSASSGETTASGALVMRNAVYPDLGQRDAVVLPYLDADAAEGLKVAFSYNYRPVRYNGATATPVSNNLIYTDTLLIQASPDGGVSWFTLWKKGGLDLNTWASILETTEATNTGQFPSGNGNWRKDTTCVQPELLGGTLMLRFLNITGMGGNIFLDNISVFESTDACLPTARAGRQTPVQQSVIMPNPTAGAVDLLLVAAQPVPARVQVLDMQGRVVIAPQSFTLHAGENVLPVSLEHLPAGLYLFHVQSGSQQITHRVVRQ